METIKKIIFCCIFATFYSFTFAIQEESKVILQAFQKSYTYEASKNFTTAIEALKKVYSEDAYEINLRLGWLSYSAGLYTESMKYYNIAATLKPYSIEAKFGLVYPASALGKWNIVIQEYNKILKISPNNSVVIYKLGLIYYNKKDFITSEKYFEKVVNLFPFDYDGLNMLGWTKYQLKKYREAKILFYKALMNTPEGASAKEGLQLLEK